jgi:hypothetical protein
VFEDICWATGAGGEDMHCICMTIPKLCSSFPNFEAALRAYCLLG